MELVSRDNTSIPFASDVPIYEDIPYYDFDLSLPARKRWKHIFNSFSDESIDELKAEARKLLKPYEFILRNNNLVLSLVPDDMIMFKEELEYIADRVGMNLLEVIVLQLIYEANSACTSGIFHVGKDKYFFRTMDWSLTFLKKYTIGLKVKRNGEVISEAITWLGVVGFFTATNITNQYSVAINYRRTNTGSIINNVIKNVTRIISGCYPVAYLVRKTINSCDIKENIKLLKNSELISPCYFTVRDWTKNKTKDKSCVITRDCDDLVNIRFDSLIQTNCDWNRKEPDILWSVERRDKFNKTVSKTNGDINDFLKFPIINDETIYIYYAKNGKTIHCLV